MNQIEMIAKACHEVNKTYCESVGDTSQVSWEEAPDWQRESAINGVKFRLENPDSTSEDIHNNWMSEKTRDGWIYGTSKDELNKTHPCMVPYEQLPVEQQTKDKLFITVVRALTE